MNITTDRSADEHALHDLFQVSKDGWNQGDGAAYAASFTEDADYILWNGTHLKGRQAIAAAHQQLFETRLQGSRLRRLHQAHPLLERRHRTALSA